MNRKEAALLLLVALSLVLVAATVLQALTEGRRDGRGPAREASSFSVRVAQPTAMTAEGSTPTEPSPTPTTAPAGETTPGGTQVPAASPTFDSSSTGDF